MEYNFREIEKKWQQQWRDSGAYKVSNESDKPKFYVLDMFPYPSGAGLHVGHPLGYIASDIYARFKRLKGFNVLHPMGFDSFGLPAEQYALETGQHPAVTTEKNIARYKEQLDNIGFCYDWSREVRTSDPKYYKWTQWIFLQLFDSWYNRKSEKAERIDVLKQIFESEGNVNQECPGDRKLQFSSEEWRSFDNQRQQEILMDYRLAFSAFGEVNWCEALGTVLANDEVVNGVSERGGHLVVKKKMRQWYLRITEYADRLLQGLEQVDFSDSMKEMQRNWIGKSQGAEITFSTSPPTPLQQSWRGEERQQSREGLEEQQNGAEAEKQGSWRGEEKPAQFSAATGKAFPKYKVSDRVQLENARINRRESTEAEAAMWEQLRNSKLGYKFRRQHPLEGFIADFACLQKGLIVEIDGGYHNTPEQQEYDNYRTKALEETGFAVIRFTNDEVLENVYTVCNKIKETIANSSKSKPETEPIPNSVVSSPPSSTSGEVLEKTPFASELASLTSGSLSSPLSSTDGEVLEETPFASEQTSLTSGSLSSPLSSTGGEVLEETPFASEQTSLTSSSLSSPLSSTGGEVLEETPFASEQTSLTSSSLSSPLSNGVGEGLGVRCYTTRPDTIFGVDFMVIAPEHELVSKITSPEQKPEIDQYLTYVKSRSERERLAEVKSITGAFTGAYAINPFNGRQIPIWISEYVLAGYGTGAIMAVPCGDQRDFAFAKHFNIPITNIIGDAYNGEEANPTKDAVLQNSEFLDGTVMRDAINIVIDKLEEMGIGKRQVNYRMRDAGFSRQRYWGEPFPIYYKGGVAFSLDESDLPVELPYVDTYSAGPEGEGPLANLSDWIIAPHGGTRETNTMPGYAGSSWYFLRYMDPHNEQAFADRKATDYWNQVDLYIGGTEHAVGHLLYSRLWTKVLFDLDYIGHEEPYKKLVNQGMITGKSYFIHLVNAYDVNDRSKNVSFFCSLGRGREFVGAFKFEGKDYSGKGSSVHFRLKNGHPFIDAKNRITEKDLIQLLEVDNSITNEFHIIWENELTEEGNKYLLTELEVEKMSKSKFNIDNPDDIIEKFGADTFRMYEMFLGPVEQSKPWDTKGIEGVHRFLRKFWRLFADEVKGLIVINDAATPAELKVLHRTIKKIEEDTERFSFNTAVSAFMVCVNELNDLKCHKREILEPLLILLTPYAPHIAEELYQLLHNSLSLGEGRGEVSVLDAAFPTFQEKYLVESSKEYPVSINGKHRTNIKISLDVAQPEVEKIVIENEVVQKWLEGKAPKKIIFVKGKMINVVI